MLSCGWDEFAYLEFMKDKISDKPFLMDVGANIGDFTMAFLQKYPEGMIYAFEPIKDIYSRLEKRFVYNENVHCFNFGLSDKEENNRTIYYVKNSEGMSSLHYRPAYFPKFQVEERKVDLTTLDIIRDTLPSVDLLKIDVEGSEKQVFNGGLLFLKETPPKFIQFEVGECYIDSHSTFKEVVDLLYSFNYKVYNKNFNLITPENVWENYDCQNYLAVFQNEYE